MCVCVQGRSGGQGYDGAANMSGKHKGAKAIIQQKYPLAVYFHCKDHSLNLALVHSSSDANIRNFLYWHLMNYVLSKAKLNMFGIVQQIAVYLGGSAKHLAVFREIDDEVEGSGMPKRRTVRS